MELLLAPTAKTNNSTISKLFANGAFVCFILEDVDRGLKQTMCLLEIEKLKVHGKTAIPEGRYEVVITFSNRFQRPLPLLVNVLGYDGIRMHPGNYPRDTEGCLLPGTGVTLDMVTSSKKAFDILFPIIESATKTEKVFITIKR